MSVSQPLTKNPISVQSLSLLVKKSISVQFSLSKALSSHWRGTSIRDLFEEEMDNKYDKNNNDNKTANNNFSRKRLGDNDDV